MSRPLAIAFFVCSLLALQIGATAPTPDDAIIARVNGDPILLSQLKESALDQDVPIASLTIAGMQGDGYRRAMTQLVDDTLLVQKATNDGLKANDMEIAKQVDGMINTLRSQMGSQEKLEQFVTQRHLTLSALRSIMTERERRRMLATQAVSRRVSLDDKMLADFKAERKAKGLPLEEVHLAQILIRCVPEDRATESGKELYRKAIRLARELDADRGSFGASAARNSDDGVSRANGGNLGWLDPESLLPRLAAQVRVMKPGDVSTPLESVQGFHILLLMGRHDAHDLAYADQFEKSRVRLVEQLRREASMQLFDLSGNPLDERPVSADSKP